MDYHIYMNEEEQKQLFDEMFPDTSNYIERRMHTICKDNPSFYMLQVLSRDNIEFREELYRDFRISREYALAFIHFLKKYNKLGEYNEYHEPYDHTKIKSIDSRRYLTFKKLVCELFFNAINYLGTDISEYTITFKNSVSTKHIIIGLSNICDDEGELCVARIITKEGCIYPLNKSHVQNLYAANKHNFHNKLVVDTFLKILFMVGEEPSITTSYKSIKKSVKW